MNLYFQKRAGRDRGRNVIMQDLTPVKERRW